MSVEMELEHIMIVILNKTVIDLKLVLSIIL